MTNTALEKKWAEEIIRHFEYLFIFQNIFSGSINSCCTANESFEKELSEKNIARFISLLEHRFITGNIFHKATLESQQSQQSYSHQLFSIRN